MISGYNSGGAVVKKAGLIVSKSISLNGFIVFRLAHKYEKRFYDEVPKLVTEGKIKYREPVTRQVSFNHCLVNQRFFD